LTAKGKKANLKRVGVIYFLFFVLPVGSNKKEKINCARPLPIFFCLWLAMSAGGED